MTPALLAPYNVCLLYTSKVKQAEYDAAKADYDAASAQLKALLAIFLK